MSVMSVNLGLLVREPHPFAHWAKDRIPEEISELGQPARGGRCAEGNRKRDAEL